MDSQREIGSSIKQDGNKSSTRKGESGKILAVAQQENLVDGLNSSERSVLEAFNRTQEELKAQAAEKAKQEKILSDLKKEGKERSAEASKAKSRIGILQKQMERTAQKLIDYEDMASVKAVVEKVRPAVEQFMIAKRKAELEQVGTIPAGENPVRESALPKSTDGKNKVSQTARTVKEAEVTPDDFADLIDKEVYLDGGFKFSPNETKSLFC